VEDVTYEGDDENEEVVVEDEGVPPREIGKFIRAQNFQTNIDIMECTANLTDGIPCLDVLDIVSETRTMQDMKDCLTGLCLMVNRLMVENQCIMRELQATRSGQAPADCVNRFDHLAFKRHNIANTYLYDGESGIPPADVNKLAEMFDLNATRCNEGAICTLRRFVKFLLDSIIPTELQNKFTVRERKSGVVHLEELPPLLMKMIRDISLESVGLLNVSSLDDKNRREDLTDYLTKFTKYALQEMRRMPRKSKRLEERSESSK